MSATTPRMVRLPTTRLTAESWKPFGTVVDPSQNELRCLGGYVYAQALPIEKAPVRLKSINRHLDQDQMFVPTNGQPMVILVAPAELSIESFDLEQMRAFWIDPETTFVININVWHTAPRGVSETVEAKAINVQGSNWRTMSEVVNYGERFGVNVEIDLTPPV